MERPPSHPVDRPPLLRRLRIFDLSLGQMLWSRRSVFLALVARRSGRCSRLSHPACRDARYWRLPRQRRAGRRRRALRHDDLAALHPIHRPGARRVLRHVAHRRRGRRQDDHVSLHAADSARRRARRQVPRVSRLHGRCSCCRRSCIVFFLIVPLGGGSIGGVVSDAARRISGCWRSAWRLTARCSRSSARGSSGRWSSGWCSRSAGSRPSCCFPGYLKRLDRCLLPAGARDARDAAGLGRQRAAAGLPRGPVDLRPAWPALAVIIGGALWLAGRTVEHREYVLEQ